MNSDSQIFPYKVQEGVPKKKEKNKISSSTVGLDLGPSTIAIVGEKEAHLEQFGQELEPIWKETKRLNKKLDRSRRKNNPEKAWGESELFYLYMKRLTLGVPKSMRLHEKYRFINQSSNFLISFRFA
ncbi:MAG: hypothetical protein HQK76_10220 [Desulfobacterales bacterium]|nr:hypothetical protein [Desulfobacterales bacterium]